MSKKYDYNLIVIGAGAAGLVSSYIAAQLNAKVALIEKNKMGGDCLNTGCVPSKALIKSAKVASLVNRVEEFGFQPSKLEFKFEDIMNRIHKIIGKIEPHDSIERYSQLGVDCIQGEAQILTANKVKVGSKEYTTRSIIIATGASPAIPPIEGIKGAQPLTSENLWQIKTQPEKLVVLGGGPIGCELAQSFNRLGSEVFQIEASEHLMPREDSDVSLAVTKKLKKEGVKVFTSHKAIEFKTINEKKYIVIEDSEGQSQNIEYNQVIVATGRRANTKGFGLQDLGVKLNPNGTIKVNQFLQSNVKSIYACGDVAGPYQFTHTAAHQAYYACVNALFRPFTKFIPPPFNKPLKVDYSVIPWATYTDPEVATVGLTEKSAKEAGVEFEVTKYGIDDLDRAITEDEDHGFVKVLTQPGSDKILGATIVASNASDLITEFISAMKNNYGLNSILATIHIYPTMAEANKYLAGNWKKKNKPEGALNLLRKVFTCLR